MSPPTPWAEVILKKDPKVALLEGLDDALVGYVENLPGAASIVPVYSQRRILRCLREQGLSHEEAAAALEQSRSTSGNILVVQDEPK